MSLTVIGLVVLVAFLAAIKYAANYRSSHQDDRR